MPSLFVSHSSADRQLVEEFGERLRVAGFEALFLDIDPEDGIPAGARWEQQLYAELRRADAVVFLHTAASAASRWCSIELGIARALRKPVFPVGMDGIERHPLLEDVQWVDVAGDGPAAYERLWAALRTAVADVRDSFAWKAGRSPYPGLSSFAPEDAAVFFGREHEITKLMDLFGPSAVGSRGRFVAVVGPSGSGKSSLIRAGLIPRLERLQHTWVVVPRVVPGHRPTAKLARSMAKAFAAKGQEHEATELESRLLQGPSALVELANDLVDVGGLDGGSVLVFIDQAEELLTRSGPEERTAFVKLVRGALQPDSPVWVVVTLRSEFLTPLVSDAGLADIVDEPFTVLPLARAQLPAVISRPAQRAGIDFEPGLVERMVDDTVGGDALPLLAYTLAQLTQRTEPGIPVSAADYEAIGGVLGALQRQADATARELERSGLGDVVLPTLLNLVTVDTGGEPTRRRIHVATLAPPEIEVVETFAKARLLKIETEGDDAICEVAHEALLRQWPPLRDAIERERHSLEQRAEIETLAEDWDAAGRDDSYLLRGIRLPAPDAIDDIARQLGPREEEFLNASQQLATREIEAARRSNHRLRRLVVGLGALFVLALGAGVFAWVKMSEADRNKEEARRQEEVAHEQAELATSRQLAAQAQALVGSSPDTALLLAIESARYSPSDEALGAIQAGLASHPHHVLTGHEFSVSGAAFSPDGRLLASAGGFRDTTVRLWDVATHEPHGSPLDAGSGAVNGVAFSLDGRLLASAHEFGTVELWDVEGQQALGDPLSVLDDPMGFNPVNGVAFSRDGLLASAQGDGTVQLWNVETREPDGDRMIHGDEPVNGVAFSPDGRLLASVGDDGTVQLWNVETRETDGDPLIHGDEPVNGVAFSPDGRLLASAGDDGTVQLWNVETRETDGDPLIHGVDPVNGVAFSPDGRLLASAGDDGTVQLWNVETRKAFADPFSNDDVAVSGVAFSPDGRLLASAGRNARDGTVRLWDLETLEPFGDPLRSGDWTVHGVAIGPDGRLLASAGAEASGTVRLWDIETREALGSPLRGGGRVFEEVGFSPDGRLLASAGDEGTVQLWNVETREADGDPLFHGDDPVWGVAFSPNGRLLASAHDDGMVRLWDVEARASSGDPLGGGHGPVYGVAFSRDGLLASAHGDGTIQLWDAENRAADGDPLGGGDFSVRGVAFSPDGRLLASAGGDGTVRLWDVETREAVGDPLIHGDDPVYGVAFSRDGRLLASAGGDGTVRLWDVEARKAVGDPLGGGDRVVYGVSFGPDGQIASGGFDVYGSARLWIGVDAWVEAACQQADRNLSLSEWHKYLGADSPYVRTCAELPAGDGAPRDAPAAGPVDLLPGS